MPQFDLRGIKIAEYINTSGTISYDNAQSVGDAMNVNLDLRYAEGRLYAESTLAEYLRKATGGTISIGVKYIPEDAQKLMYGSRSKSRTIGSGQSTKTITSLQRGANDVPSYVGVAFYAPDMIDGEEKYTCVLVTRALFGPPGMSLQTMGESIVSRRRPHPASSCRITARARNSSRSPSATQRPTRKHGSTSCWRMNDGDPAEGDTI